jgi:micrococcal nuclease
MHATNAPVSVAVDGTQARSTTWFARHKALTTVLVVLLLFLFIAQLGDDEPTGSSSSEPTTSESEPEPETEPDSEPSEPSEEADPRPKAKSSTSAPAEPEKRIRRYAVLRVIDGDTVELDYKGGTTVRVIGIDTPETVSPSVPDECGGPAASRTAHQLLDGERVAIRFDATQGRRDYYGRLLAYLSIPGVGDFGLAMLKRGRAAEDTYDSAYKMQGRYQRAEAQARSTDRNMWGKCGGPDKPMRVVPEPESADSNCSSGYDPCIPAYPPDLDCADVSGPIMVTGNDPHGLDAEDDGVACE